MFDMDYKDYWQEFYDHAIEELGMDKDAAGNYADDKQADRFAGSFPVSRGEANIRMPIECLGGAG
jgi:hypothetical protein